MILTIGLTGGIGSGKTAVSDLFQKLSFEAGFSRVHIIDADVISRNLLAGSIKHKPTAALKQVRILFGNKLFDSSGYLQRAQLRELIFSSRQYKQQLEALLHPLIYKEIYSQIKQLAKATDEAIIIVVIPLLFETSNDYHFDRILVVDVPVQTQLQRAASRDNCTEQVLQKIIDSQLDRHTKLTNADDIIDNSGGLAELEAQVKALFQNYLSLIRSE